ncbi:MAG TPA: hypothetical protein VE733_28405 [Streptosporangiaceae bacterium]|jgi:hypothetical protein|nr:hypothetical protein [Streptosporangiaceae bacterium]
MSTATLQHALTVFAGEGLISVRQGRRAVMSGVRRAAHAGDERLATPVPAKPPVPDRDIDAVLADYAAGIKQDPWLTMWPVVVDGTPMPPEPGSGQPWYLTAAHLDHEERVQAA